MERLHFDLSYKRLERGRFSWPPIENGVMKLTQAQMTLLLGGMDWRRLEENAVKKPQIAG